MPERDFPVGHPAASDYAGQPYKAPRSPFLDEFPEGHLARNGKNIRPVDSPDGMRQAFNSQSQHLQELAAIGSLPALTDLATGEPVPLSSEQLAHVYAVRHGLSLENQALVTDQYHLDPMAEARPELPVVAMTPQQQAIKYFTDLGYTPERGQELIDQYGVPTVLTKLAQDAHR